MITIQKLILLLSDFHYNEFVKYLIDTKADLPVKLISIVRNPSYGPDTDKLCTLLYGDSEGKNKKKFLQLTHYTFKLSSFLSRNYPNYLKHNLQIIEELLSKGNKQKALNIAKCLYDIAEKIEDYTTLIEVSKYYAQHSFLLESKDVCSAHQKVNEFLVLEQTKNNIYHYLRENLYYKGKGSIVKNRKTRSLVYFDHFINHHSHSINILARFGKYYELCFLGHPNFYKEETRKNLAALERDFLNNAHVCFHYLDDLYYKILGLRLQLDLNNNDTNSFFLDVKKMRDVSSFLEYWNSYINLSELFSFSTEANYYLNFQGFIFRHDYRLKLPKEIKKGIFDLKSRIESELVKEVWRNNEYAIKLVNLKSIYAAILLTGNDLDKQESLNIINDALLSNKQMPFQKFIDGMFVILIMGLFSLKKYGDVVTNFKRYKKVTLEYRVLKENDLTIDAYYYVSQYLISNRSQYLRKLKFTFDAATECTHVKRLIEELVSYFVIPLEL
jgi:hypothetical protein